MSQFVQVEQRKTESRRRFRWRKKGAHRWSPWLTMQEAVDQSVRAMRGTAYELEFVGDWVG